MDPDFILILILGIATGILGMYVASQKNRSRWEGFLLGFIFSLLGVIVVVLLPTKSRSVELNPSNQDPTSLQSFISTCGLWEEDRDELSRKRRNARRKSTDRRRQYLTEIGEPQEDE